MRISNIERNTAETKIKLTLNIDGSGKSNINTGVGFFDHMLTLFARHGGFDLDVVCDGDIEVDAHHTVEDVGICLGKAFAEALGDRRGICRYGDIILPMDEALMLWPTYTTVTSICACPARLFARTWERRSPPKNSWGSRYP